MRALSGLILIVAGVAIAFHYAAKDLRSGRQRYLDMFPEEPTHPPKSLGLTDSEVKESVANAKKKMEDKINESA